MRRPQCVGRPSAVRRPQCGRLCTDLNDIAWHKEINLCTQLFWFKLKRIYLIWSNLILYDFDALLLATRILSLFSSTYVCEASFSALNNIKSKRRSKLTDEHLWSALICAVSNLKPDYEFLSTDQQCQPSHKNIIDFNLINKNYLWNDLN